MHITCKCKYPVHIVNWFYIMFLKFLKVYHYYFNLYSSDKVYQDYYDFVNFRLFDSQNNNRGGYNVGSLYYYAGSTLPIEW